MDDVSYNKHNELYAENAAFTREKLAHERQNIEDFKFLYQDDVPHGDVLDNSEFKTAIDIGSGTGWFANYLVNERKYTKVYAIEPSESAINTFPILSRLLVKSVFSQKPNLFGMNFKIFIVL